MMYFSLGLIILLCCLSPGSDFILVTRNSLAGSRKLGVFTALGIAFACMFHATYNILGIGLLIQTHKALFAVIKYLGALYLIYIGVQGFIALRANSNSQFKSNYENGSLIISNFEACKQGMLCNLLNPKAYLFFISIFTLLIDCKTLSFFTDLVIVFEIFTIVFLWFALLSIILSHRHVVNLYLKFSKNINLILCFALILLGILFIVY